MHWLALLSPPAPPDEAADRSSPRPEQAPTTPALAWWALQFSPRVAALEEAVVLEVAASLRLFGGPEALHQRVAERISEAGLSLAALAWAPTALAALALARGALAQPGAAGAPGEACVRADGLSTPLASLLDPLPLFTLSAAQAQAPMLARLGCRTLGDVRRLPRAALSRRFGPGLLRALDQAYGQAPQAHAWITAPEQFQARLELPQRLDNALALLQHAQELLRQLCAWLAARHAGIETFELAWAHDAMRARDIGPGGRLLVHSAALTRDFGQLSRLLHEHLLRLELAAPVAELSLQAGEVRALEERSASLLPAGPEQAKEPLEQLLMRLSIRLGAQAVRCGQLQQDHRLEQMQRWVAWNESPPHTAATAAAPDTLPLCPQPTWLLAPPLRLSLRQDQPVYGGAPLQLLAGPQRIEGGWWQPAADGQSSQHQQRDYFLASSPQAGLLWIFQQRLSSEEEGWFLHGLFA